MHGMISQVEGLANALGLSFKHEKIQLKNIWNLIPPKFTPVFDGILEKKFICDSKVIISCGWKSVIPSILLKRRFKNEIFNIHIQDPKVNFNNFDSIICPEHDDLLGDNVIKTKGAIHYLTNKEIQKNINYLKPNQGDKKVVAFIIGGPNKYYSFSEKQMDGIFAKIKNMFISSKYKLIIIPSSNTLSEEEINKLKDFQNKGGALVIIGKGALNNKRDKFVAAGKAIHKHEKNLTQTMIFGYGNIAGLSQINKVNIIGGLDNPAREGLVSMYVDDIDSAEIVNKLNKRGIRTHLRKADHYSGNILNPLK